MESLYEKMLKQYEQSHKSNDGYDSESKYDEKNYFSTTLPDKVNEGTKRIRILPPLEGEETPFKGVWVHKKKVDGKMRTFPCLKHEYGEDCPFCEAKDAIKAEGESGDKDLLKYYYPREVYVVRVIDRDNEDHGVKFWRFNKDFRKQGAFDKIMKAMMAVKHDITDPETGRDLNIEIARDTNKIPNVQAVTYPLESTPLSTDPQKLKTWLSDTRTWEDVYSVKKYDYLHIIVEGGIPAWDNTLKKYVPKGEPKDSDDSEDVDALDAELTLGSKKVENATPTSAPTTNTTVDSPTVIDEEEDDLPF
jgi:hypothetical protein